MPKYLTMDDYIGALPASAQKFAVELRETILAVAQQRRAGRAAFCLICQNEQWR
jgi:hypothetical protein